MGNTSGTGQNISAQHQSETFSSFETWKQEKEQEALRQKGRETLERWRRHREIEKRRAQQERDLQILTDIIYQFQNLSLQQLSPHRRIQHDPQLVKEFFAATPTIFTRNMDINIYTTALIEGTREYETVKRLFTSTNKNFFKIHKILEVINPFLLLQYKLKQIQYKQRHKFVEERNLFHGTEMRNVNSICQNNFDWRLTGKSKGHKFGQGVSFTPVSNYATNYGEKTLEKVMILAKVLVSKECLGNKDMEIPPGDYDTSTNGTEQVVVKYEDNSFYPSYVIYYNGIDYSKCGRRRKKKII